MTNSVKIEVGRKYRLRNGDVVDILCTDYRSGDPAFPETIIARAKMKARDTTMNPHDALEYYLPEGRMSLSEDSPYDIVELIED